MIIELPSAQGVQKLWKQERNIVHINDQYYMNVVFWTNLHGTQQAPIAIYRADSSGSTYVDITDYLRTYPNVTTMYFGEGTAEGDVYMTLSVSVEGLISPSSVIIPTHALDAEIIPPSMMYLPNDHNLADLIAAEIYASGGGIDVTGLASLHQGERYIGQINGDFIVTIGDDSLKYVLRFFDCVDTAFVRWTSFTGVTRCHLMERARLQISAAESISLLTMDNSYNEIKGREDSLVLRLNGLSQYDLWYYADMITSSKVEISLDGVTWAQVQVTTKSMTIPDGESTNGKIEIGINWKRYDAVAM